MNKLVRDETGRYAARKPNIWSYLYGYPMGFLIVKTQMDRPDTG